MDKEFLLQQLRAQIERVAQGALEASVDASDEARTAADSSDRQSDSKNAVELANLAHSQNRRRSRALAELANLESFRPPQLQETSKICVGALVEIEDEDTGQGRTFFLAPVGAGATLHGPDGDGHLSVVTPKSPIGSAVLGKRVGDVIDVTIKGELYEWAIVWVG